MTLVSCISMTYFYDIYWFSYHISNLNDVDNFRLLILWFGIETMCLQCVKTHNMLCISRFYQFRTSGRIDS